MDMENEVSTPASDNQQIEPSKAQEPAPTPEAAPSEQKEATPSTSYNFDKGLTAEKLVERAQKAKKIAKETTPKGDIQVGQKSEKTEEKAPSFTPKEKYTGVNKEFEVPSWAKSLVKDAETEKNLHDVLTKAAGLDFVKTRHQELFDKHSELQGNHQQLVGGVQELRDIYADAVQSGNLLKLDGFFEKLKIPPQVILQYALSRVQFEELPQDQKQTVLGHMQAERRAKDLESQTQLLSNNALAAESRARGLQLDSVLAKPDIASVVQAFDSAPGRKSGAFRELVREHGEYAWYKSQGKVDLSPEEAVQQVMSKGYANGTQAPVANQAPIPQQAPSNQIPVSPHRDVPVIPNVAGKSSSPTKQRIKSIADLKKVREEMYGS